MRIAIVAAAAAVVVVSAAAQAQPAHLPPPGWVPFAAVYDGNAPVLLKGEVVGVDWSRPHVWIHMVDAQTGQAWKVEGGAPETLAAKGLSRERFARGTKIIVRGYQAKDKRCTPECLVNARDVTFADGPKVFMDAASGNPPAPVGVVAK